MIEIKYDLTSYGKFLEQAASALGTKVVNNTIYVPPNLGTGTIRHIKLAAGADAILSCFRFTEDLLLERNKNAREFYTFCCDMLTDAQDFSMTIESDTFHPANDDLSAMYLTSYLYDIGYFFKKNSLLHSVRILLSPEWMRKNLGFDDKREVVQQYLELKTAGLLFKKIDADARQIMASLFAQQEANQPTLYYMTRVLSLLEKFSSWLTPEIMSRPNGLNISKADIERVRMVEELLTSDFASPPYTIARLAKTAAVSESKLKTIFKAVYGLPIYEYYQKHRMEKARVMLLSNEYAIKDVGYAVGYTNLSNFTLAFKKQFNQLPRELLK